MYLTIFKLYSFKYSHIHLQSMDHRTFLIFVVLCQLIPSNKALQCNDWNRTIVWVPAKSINHYISRDTGCDWTEKVNHLVKFHFKLVDMSDKSVVLFDTSRKKHFKLTETKLFEGNDENNIHNFLFYGGWKVDNFCVNFCNS